MAGGITREEMVKQLRFEFGFTIDIATDVIDEVFTMFQKSLLEKGCFDVRNFGSFRINRWKARKARNPRTGEPMVVADKNTVRFKPSVVFNDKLQQIDYVLVTTRKQRKPRKSKIANPLNVRGQGETP